MAKIYWLAVVACINGTRFNDRTGAQQTGPVQTGPINPELVENYNSGTLHWGQQR
jgi:hypothetical protein